MHVKFWIVALLAASVMWTSNPSKAEGQISDMGMVLAGGIEDAEKIAGAYFSPYANAFAGNLNAGWYNTANTHRLLGFDVTLSLNVAVVPDHAKTFELDELGDLTGNVSDGSTAPTVATEFDGNRPSLHYFDNTVSYELPNGTGLGYIPSPTFHLGVGVPFDTDIIVRYMPDVKVGRSGNMQLWGVGIKHSVKQWIPFLRRVPVLNVSVMAGYTNFSNTAGLDFHPADIQAEDLTTANVIFDDQKLDFTVNSYTANLIASADIPFLTFYGGVGVNHGSSRLKMFGHYPTPELDDNNNLVVTDESATKDPVNIKMGDEGNGLQPRLNAGFKFKLAILHFHLDYIYSEYSIASAGVSISFR